MSNNVQASPQTGGGPTFASLELTSGPTGGTNVQHSAQIICYSDGTGGGTKFVSSTTPLPTILTRGTSVEVSVTRPANTTAYTANDVVGAAAAAITFALPGVSAGEFSITAAELMIEASALISGETSYILYLYDVTPPSALADNAAFDLSSGDRNAFVGSINIGTPADLGSTCYIRADQTMAVTLLSANLYGYLVTVGAYTPTSASVRRVTLHGYMS